MFRKTDPQQHLFGVDTALPPKTRVRLKASWAETFRREILPILMRAEEDFAVLYGITGRPNFSVGRMLGLCFLQELCGFSDQEALDAFAFDARWQYALELDMDEDAYLSRRSLVEFRSRLAEKDQEMRLMRRVFEMISDAAINKLGLSVGEQRLDSTHVASNIHTHGRIDLFQSTLQVFIRSLSELKYGALPEDIRKWFEEESNGWFGLGSDKQKRDKLQRLASFVYRLIAMFEKDEEVAGSEAYQLLVRLFGEHCEVKETGRSREVRSDEPVVVEDSTEDSGKADDDDDFQGGGQVECEDESAKSENEKSENTKSQDSEGEKSEAPEIQIKKNSSGDTLQSPHDPDASYGHKGVGYSVQIAETCNNKDKPEIITGYEVHGAARSDRGKALDMVEQLEGTQRKPAALFADGGYPTVPSVPKILEHGVELVAPVDRGPMSADVMGRDRFEFDEQEHVAKCPAGHVPIDHRILSNGEEPSLHAIFDGDTCRGCPMLEICPVRAPNHRKKGQSPRETVGNFRLETTAALLLRDEMYAEQQTAEWKERYKIRAGIEATMSEGKRYGMGKLRVRGMARVHLAVVCKVIACNIRRWARAQTALNGRFGEARGSIWWPKHDFLDCVCRILPSASRLDPRWFNLQLLYQFQLCAQPEMAIHV